MSLFLQRLSEHRGLLSAALLASSLLTGCANPGPPRAPSLFFPAPPKRITAERLGNIVELRFEAPARSTDGLPLRRPTLSGTLCRAVESSACVAVGQYTVAAKDAHGQPSEVVWSDALPVDLASGTPRVLSYRVSFANPKGVSGPPSDPVYAAAGAPPPPVLGLRAEGSRAGAILRWKPEDPAAGDVLLRREDLSATAAATRKNREPGVVWITANGPGNSLETSAQPDTPYRYTAVRERTVQLGGRTLKLRSEGSAPIDFTLHELYAPGAPTGVNIAGYFTGTPPQFAVDLIWQPVFDATKNAALAGYNVYRQRIDANNAALGDRSKLNASPVPIPAFHDATAKPNERYRYNVTTVDARGNESAAATAIAEPAQQP